MEKTSVFRVPYSEKGKVSSVTEQSGVNIINQIRFTARLPSSVGLDDNYGEAAPAAYVNAIK